jgi:hypothetical protein
MSNMPEGYSERSVIGVPLHDGKTARHALIDIVLDELEAAAVNALAAHQIFQKRTIAAADVEDARAGRNHIGNGGKVRAQG